MILYDNSQLPVVIIHFKHSDWNKVDYRQFITAIEQILINAAMNKQPIKLLFRGNSDQADIKSSIPLSVYAWIICDIIRIKPLFLNGLERTAIYTPDDNMNFFLRNAV